MAAVGRVYEEYDPSTKRIQEDNCDTLVVDLPGFMKQNLRVQVTSDGNVRVSGERQQVGNKWNRFTREFPIPSNCEINKIKAKFEYDKLYVTLPKQIASAAARDEKAKQQAEAARREDPTKEPQPAENGHKKTDQGGSTEAREGKTMPGIGNEERKDAAASKKSEEKGDQKKKNTEDVDGKPGEFADKAQDTAKDATRLSRDRRKSSFEKYKQAADGMVPCLKKPGKFMNMALVVFSVMILGLYVRSVYRSFGTSKDN